MQLPPLDEFNTYFNFKIAKIIATSLVMGFIIYHGILHAVDGGDSCYRLLSKGRFQGSNVWQPYGCMMHTYSTEDTRRCLRYVAFLKQSNHVVLVGDSRIRQLYRALVKQISVSPMVNNNNNDQDEQQNHHNGNDGDGFTHDNLEPSQQEGLEDKAHHDLHYHEADLKLRLSFYWRPSMDASVLELLERWKYKPSTAPSLLVLGAGVHTIKQHNTSAHALLDYTNNITLLAQSLASDVMGGLGSGGRVLWMLQEPVLPERLNKHRAHITNHLIDQYNRAAMQVLAESPVLVWSSARLVAQGSLSDFSDGLHAGHVTLMYYIQLLLNLYCNNYLNFDDGSCCNTREGFTSTQITSFVALCTCSVVMICLSLKQWLSATQQQQQQQQQQASPNKSVHNFKQSTILPTSNYQHHQHQQQQLHHQQQQQHEQHYHNHYQGSSSGTAAGDGVERSTACSTGAPNTTCSNGTCSSSSSKHSSIACSKHSSSCSASSSSSSSSPCFSGAGNKNGFMPPQQEENKQQQWQQQQQQHEATTTTTASTATAATTAAAPSLQTVLRALGKLGLIMGYFFLCDRTGLFMKENKYFSEVNFWFPLGYMLALGLFFTEDTPHTRLLHRDITDEWKGWMQLVILVYHMTGSSVKLSIYLHVRVLVSAYLFLTGFGHFSYAWAGRDMGVVRYCQVMFRMNFLTVLLCLVMNRPYQFYYFVPLVSFWYTVLHATLVLPPLLVKQPPAASQLLAAQAPLVNYFYSSIKFVSLAGFVTVLFLSEVFFEKVFVLRPWKALFVTTDDDIHEWWFRWQVDRHSVLYGAVFALLYRASLQFGVLDDTSASNLVSGRPAVLLSVLAVACLSSYFVLARFCGAKRDCNQLHPYVVWIPILGYIIARNQFGSLRTRFSSFFAWFGRLSLELFVCQYHVWLAADTHGVLVLIPSYPVANVLLTSFIFLCVAKEIHDTTNVLMPFVVPNNSWRAVRNLSIFLFLLLGLAVHDGIF